MRISYNFEVISPIKMIWYNDLSWRGTITGISYSLSMVIDASFSTSKPILPYISFRLSACLRMKVSLHGFTRITSWESAGIAERVVKKIIMAVVILFMVLNRWLYGGLNVGEKFLS